MVDIYRKIDGDNGAKILLILLYSDKLGIDVSESVERDSGIIFKFVGMDSLKMLVDNGILSRDTDLDNPYHEYQYLLRGETVDGVYDLTDKGMSIAEYAHMRYGDELESLIINYRLDHELNQ